MKFNDRSHSLYRKPRTTIPHIEHKVYPYLIRHLEIAKPNLIWAWTSPASLWQRALCTLHACWTITAELILSSVISNTLDPSFCLEANVEAVSLYGSPEIISSEQSWQFKSDAFVSIVATSGERLSINGKSAWLDNIITERFWRSLKFDEVYLRAGHGSVAKLWMYQHIERFNIIRPHTSLGGKTQDKIHRTKQADDLFMAT